MFCFSDVGRSSYFQFWIFIDRSECASYIRKECASEETGTVHRNCGGNEELNLGFSFARLYSCVWCVFSQ